MSEEKDKEALINERIEKIRQKNEAIRRRHMEVEEDRQNADVFSSTVVPSNKPKPKTELKPPRERSAPRPRPQERTVPRKAAEPRESAPRVNSGGKIYSNFAEGEGPPPDPGYSFLADDERDAPKVEVKSTTSTDSEKSSKNSSRGRYGSKARGRRQDQRPQRSPPKGRGGGVSGDDKWRAERAAIDEARIQRQKTAEGSWRREWDIQKEDEEELVNRDDGRHATHTRGGPRRPQPNQWKGNLLHKGCDSKLLTYDDERSNNGSACMQEKPPEQQRDIVKPFHKPAMNLGNKEPLAQSITEPRPALRMSMPQQGFDFALKDNRNSKPPAQFSVINSDDNQGLDCALLVTPSLHVLRRGEDLRVLLRSKSSELPDQESSRNAPERRSFGSGRTGHNQGDSRSSQSEDDSHAKYSKSYSELNQGFNQSDLPQLKVTVRTFGERAATLYQNHAPPRPLHCQTAKHDLEKDVTSLPPSPFDNVVSSSNNINSEGSKKKTVKSTVSSKKGTSGIDEGEESWEDYSD